MIVVLFYQYNSPSIFSFFVDQHKPLTRYFSLFILFNNQLMAQQAPEFKLVLVGDGGVGMYLINI
jgi:hypothetical protein